jgi:5S rRNA maturation endonuclease (ribonuclease M5)
MDKSKKRLDWEEIAKISYHEARNYYQQQGDALTLRGLFYILVSKNVIPNTKSAYKTLSDVLARLRYAGEFPAYLIKDVTRKSSFLEQIEKYATELTEEDIKKMVKDLIESYSSYSINPWTDQKNRVIIALEKEALFDITSSWIDELNVDGIKLGVYNLRCLKGFDSATDIISLAKTVKKLKEEGYIPVILVISDFDPSGEEIFTDFRNRLIELSGIKDLTVEKIMVTKEQIQKFNLPSAPESQEEIEKLRRDPRYKKFVETHGLMRVETDALYSILPDKAKEILHNSILKYFDKSIFDTKTKLRMQEARQKSEEAKRNMLDKVKKILGE